MTTPRDDVSALSAQVQALQAQTQALSATLAEVQRRARRRDRALLVVGLLTGLTATVAVAADGNCPNGLQFCFAADTAARASDVNHNFSLLKEWIELKVGTVGSSAVTMAGSVTVNGALTVNGASAFTSGPRIQLGGTSNVAAAAGKALFVSSAMGDGQSGNGGVEIRHDNLTQGVGIGYNTVYATGSSGDQPLNLRGRGNSPVIVLGDLSVTGNTWTTSTPTGDGRFSNPNGFNFTDCANGQYVCGLGLGHVGGDGNYWTGARIQLRCCSL